MQLSLWRFDPMEAPPVATLVETAGITIDSSIGSVMNLAYLVATI